MARRRRHGDDDVPRIPRGRGLSLSWTEVTRIVLVAAMLVTVIVLQKPCSEAVGRFVANFDPPADAAVPAGDAGVDALPAGYVRLSPDMSEEELRQAMSEARSKSPAVDAGPDAARP